MSDPKVREAIEKLARSLSEHPEKSRAKNAPATATLESGLRCRVTGPHGEVVHTDMPAAMGGAASGPNPGWLLRAALASCNATVIAMRAARMGIALDTLDVTVESESDNRGILGLDDRMSAGLSALRTIVRIGGTGATPEQIRELVAWAEQHSPVACTVRDDRPSTLEVVTV